MYYVNENGYTLLLHHVIAASIYVYSIIFFTWPVTILTINALGISEVNF
jgi:hypothetical protein